MALDLSCYSPRVKALPDPNRVESQVSSADVRCVQSCGSRIDQQGSAVGEDVEANFLDFCGTIFFFVE